VSEPLLVPTNDPLHLFLAFGSKKNLPAIGEYGTAE
jgi:hypothetical protein